MIQYTPDRSSAYQQGFGGEASARMCQYIEDNPTNAVLMSLGIGFGVGLLLGTALAGSSNYFAKEESFAERISHRVADSLSSAIPSSWKGALRS